jgi:hypothetical protein
MKVSRGDRREMVCGSGSKGQDVMYLESCSVAALGHGRRLAAVVFGFLGFDLADVFCGDIETCVVGHGC